MKYGAIIPCRNISPLFNCLIIHNYIALKDNNIPVIFIDNKSEDNSVDLIRTLNCEIIQNDIDGGFAYSVNKGIRYLNDFLECESYLIISADAKVNVDLIVSLKDMVWNKEWGYLSFSENYTSKAKEYLEESYPSSASVFMIHRETIEKVGYYDEEYYLYGEDNDYFIRIKKKGLMYVKSPESFEHIGQSYSTNNKYSNLISSLCYRNYLLVFKKNRMFLSLFRAIIKSLIFVVFGNMIFIIKKRSRQIERFTNLEFRLRLIFFLKALRYMILNNGNKSTSANQ